MALRRFGNVNRGGLKYGDAWAVERGNTFGRNLIHHSCSGQCTPSTWWSCSSLFTTPSFIRGKPCGSSLVCSSWQASSSRLSTSASDGRKNRGSSPSDAGSNFLWKTVHTTLNILQDLRANGLGGERWSFSCWKERYIVIFRNITYMFQSTVTHMDDLAYDRRCSIHSIRSIIRIFPEEIGCVFLDVGSPCKSLI